MPNNLCILITNEYPYDNREPFLELEMNYNSKYFESIEVYTLRASRNQNISTLIPNNVKIHDCKIIRNNFFRFIFGLFKIHKGLKLDYSTAGKFISTCIYRYKATTITKKIIRGLSKSTIHKYSSITIYSYWLSLGLVPILLKKYISSLGINYNVKTISRGHGYDIYSEQMPFNYSPYQEYCIRHLNLIYPCSKTGKQYIIKKYNNNSQLKINVSRLGTINPQSINKCYSLKREVTFVTCSGFRKVKRLDSFANVFCNLYKKHKNIKWIAIGDGPELPKTKTIINNNNLQNKVIFCGSITNEKVYVFFKNNEVSYFINVSSSEGIPVSIMEAMSFGIPTIATNVGGNHEIVIDSHNGFLINDEKEIYDVIDKALSITDNEYIELKKNAFEYWNNNFNANKNYEKWAEEISK